MLFSLPICVIMVWVMNMDELKKRKTPRYQSFDYNSSGVYFITICTQNIRCILSRIVGTGVLDCPQQKNFGRDVVFSADLCYNGVGDEYG